MDPLQGYLDAGGLGDVMAALPKALARRGHRVMAVAPRYENYAEGWETGARLKIRVYDQDQEVEPLPEPTALRFRESENSLGLFSLLIEIFKSASILLTLHCRPVPTMNTPEEL